MAMKKDGDHFAFLEDIEAPMWVDLATEAQSINQELDDEWFHTSHSFHQCSSRQLKTAFSHLQSNGNSVFDLGESASPKLPSSVSKSRGKHYISRNWRRDSCISSANKQHPVEILRGKSSLSGSGTRQEIKSKSSHVNPKGITSSSTKGRPGNIAVPHCSNTSSTKDSSSLSSLENKSGESDSKSTVTFASSQHQQQEVVDVSNQLVARKTGLLSVMRLSLRKSYATRPASRVEITDGKQTNGWKSSPSKTSVGSSSNPSLTDGKQTIGCKSSSSKSSVGSSSRPSHALRDTDLGRRWIDKTPESRNVSRLSQSVKNRQRVNVQKDSKAKLGNKATEYSKGSKVIVAKSGHQEAAKSKAPVQRKGLVSLKVNEQGSLNAARKEKDKLQARGVDRLQSCGKENILGVMVGSQKPARKASAGRDMARGQKVTLTEVQKGGRTGSLCLKEKTSGQVEGRKTVNATQKVYHR